MPTLDECLKACGESQRLTCGAAFIRPPRTPIPPKGIAAGVNAKFWLLCSDAYLEAFGYTLFLFLVSGVLSMGLGTILVAMRVGPIAVLRPGGGGLRHRGCATRRW